MTTRVCLVGCGARTPVGLTAASSAAAVRAGVSAVREHPFLMDRAGEPMKVASDHLLSDDLEGVERFLSLAVSAAREATAALPRDVPLVTTIGLPSARPGLPPGLSSAVTAFFQREGALPNRSVRVEAKASGHAAGLMAIESAFRDIEAGSDAVHLAGGVDSYLCAPTLEWLDETEQLHSIDNKWGFCPGEAAGMCLLASPSTAARYRLPVLARVTAVATAREKHLIRTDSICLGEGLTAAIRKVLESLPEPLQIAHTLCDMNGEHYRVDEYGFTVTRLSPRFEDASDVLTPADCWGDVGAASGPLFAILAAASAERGYARGRNLLLWTSSEGGDRCAALVQIDPNQRKSQ